MPKKYHVNPATGEPGVCEAVVQCRFGALEKHHYASAQAARKAFEGDMELQGVLTRSLSRKKVRDQQALLRALDERTTEELAASFVESYGGMQALVQASGHYDSYAGGHRKLTVGEDTFRLLHYSEPFIGRRGNYSFKFELNRKVFLMEAVGDPRRWAPPQWSTPRDVTPRNSL